MKDLGIQQRRRNGCMPVSKRVSKWIFLVYGLCRGKGV